MSLSFLSRTSGGRHIICPIVLLFCFLLCGGTIASSTTKCSPREHITEIPNSDQFASVEDLLGPESNPSPLAVAFQEENCKWTASLCMRDSDQDGYTNGQELGDACCTFKYGKGIPARTSEISNPNNQTSTPPENLVSILSPNWNLTNLHQGNPDDSFNIHLKWDMSSEFTNGLACLIYVYFRPVQSNQWSVLTYLGDFQTEYFKGNLQQNTSYVFKFTPRLPDGQWKNSFEFEASTGVDTLGAGVGDDCDMGNVQQWSEVYGNVTSEAKNATIRIERSQTVYLDQSAHLYKLEILGCLIFDDQGDYNLTAEKIFVTGKLQIGTEAQPYQHKAQIYYTGQKTNESFVGHGNKVMVVSNGGVLELHGKPKGPNWVRLTQTASKGATQLHVATPDTMPSDASLSNIGWEVGDSIVIASTDFDYKQAEELTITAIQRDVSTSSAVIDFQPPLKYTHYGEKQYFTKTNGDKVVLDERAEVGLLSHNILLRGEDSDVNYGCDNKFMATSKRIRISNIEVTKCGKLGIIGRYPLHYHVPSPFPDFALASREQDYIKFTSVHHTFQRALTLHGAHNATVDQLVFYHHNGHGLFFEDGIEQGNRITNCLGLGTSRIPDASAILRTERLANADAEPSTYWISNPNNYFEGNVAAGSASHGFWYQLDRYTMGGSATPYVRPQNWPYGGMAKCTSHSNGGRAVNLWHDFHPCERPEEYATCGSASNPYVESVFKQITAYKNRGEAFFGYVVGDLDFDGSVFADSARGFTFNVVAGSSVTAENVAIIGESDNKGNPDAYPNSCWDCRKCDDYLDPTSKYHRTIPKHWSRQELLEGIVFNRDGGQQTIQNVAFFNFEDNCERAASAISVRNDERAFSKPYSQFIGSGVEFHSAKPVHNTFRDPNTLYAAGTKSDGYRSAVLVDTQGLVTSSKAHGGQNARIIPNNSIMRDETLCALVPEWNMYVCDSSTVFRHLLVESIAMSNEIGDLNITASHGSGSAMLKGFSFTSTFPASWTYRLNSIYSESMQEYDIQYTGRIGTPDKVTIKYEQNTLSQPAGDSRFNLRYTVWGPLEIDLKLENGETLHLNAFNDTIPNRASYNCETNILSFSMQEVAHISVKDALSTPPEKNCITLEGNCDARENCHAETLQGKCVGENDCVCRWGWMNANCSQFHCIHARGCSGNGVCVGPNQCRCFPGFSGNMCNKFAQFNLFDVVLSFGDIHVTTLDSQEHYVFNSIGEFYMLKSAPVTVQARLLECTPGSKTSCMKAVSIKGDTSSTTPPSRIMFEGLDSDQVSIRIDGKPVVLDNKDPLAPVDIDAALEEIKYQRDPESGKFADASKEDVTSTQKTTTAFVRTEDGTVVTTTREGGFTWYYISFTSGTRIRLRNDGVGFLSVGFSPAKDQKFSGAGVGGLYGNRDNNKENDFMLRDGTVLTTPNSQQIHQVFGESWRVPQNESLFDYLGEDSYSSINDLSFEPQLEVTPAFDSETLKREATNLCGETLKLSGAFLEACLYDVAQTKDLKFAQAAASSNALSACSTSEEDCQRVEASNVITCTPWNQEACKGLGVWAIVGISGGSAIFILACCLFVLSVIGACSCLSFMVISRQRRHPEKDHNKSDDPNFLDLRLSKGKRDQNPLRFSKNFDEEELQDQPTIKYNTKVPQPRQHYSPLPSGGSSVSSSPYHNNGVEFETQPVEHLY